MSEFFKFEDVLKTQLSADLSIGVKRKIPPAAYERFYTVLPIPL